MKKDYHQLARIVTEMEALVEQEGLDDEASERLSDLYEEFQELYAIEMECVEEEREMQGLHRLKKRFDLVCSQFETPTQIHSGVMKSMFPDREDLDEPDMDDLFGLS